MARGELRETGVCSSGGHFQPLLRIKEGEEGQTNAASRRSACASLDRGLAANSKAAKPTTIAPFLLSYPSYLCIHQNRQVAETSVKTD